MGGTEPTASRVAVQGGHAMGSDRAPGGSFVLSRMALHLIVRLPTGDYMPAEAQRFIDAVEQCMPRVFRELGLPPVEAKSWRAEELSELACQVLALDYQRRLLLSELRRRLQRARG